MSCNGMEWNGMKWNEMEWNGMKWNEMEWNESVAERRKIYIVSISRRILQNGVYISNNSGRIRGHFLMRVVFIYTQLP